MPARIRSAGRPAVEFVALLLLCCFTFGALFALGGRLRREILRRLPRASRRLRRRRPLRSRRAPARRGVRRTRRGDGPRARAEPRLRAGRAAAPGRLAPLPAAGCADGARRSHARRARGLATGSRGRGRATAFTRLIRRAGRLYIQYWLYYPDSNTVLAGADRVWERSWLLPRVRELVSGTPDYPGFHEDDWEGVFVRLDPDGTAWIRASSHGHLQGCKWRACHDLWVRGTGWVRMSRGSHAATCRSEASGAGDPGHGRPHRDTCPCRRRRGARRCCRAATWTSEPPRGKASPGPARAARSRRLPAAGPRREAAVGQGRI